MAHFHIPTVFLILGFLLLLMPTITWLVLADRQSRPIGLWCGGGISIGVGVVLVALRGQLPAWATFPLAGLMIFLCIMMQIQSMRMDLGMPCHMAWIFAPALLYVLGVEVIRLGLDNLPLVAIYNHTIFFAFSMYLAFLAWRIGQREQSHCTPWIASVYLLMAGTMLFNIIAFSFGWAVPSADAVDSNPARLMVGIIGIPTAVVNNLAFIGLALERSRHQVAEADEEYHAIIEACSDGFWACDLEGRFVDVNRAFCNMIGYRRDELLSMCIFQVEAEKRHDKANAQIDHILDTGYDRFETQYRRKDGGIIDVEISTIYLSITGGKFVVFIRDISARKRTEAEINKLAFYDPLTHLPNRRLLVDRLRLAMVANKRNGHYGALMLLDLDNFKPLNDTHGHDVGDLLLIEAAGRMVNAIREGDTVARLGGDEFVVLLSELKVDKAESTLQACMVADKIRLALSEPYRLKVLHQGEAETAVEYSCSATIGLTLFCGVEHTQEAIFKRSDQAMYQAKEKGRNRVQVYEPEIIASLPPS